MRNRYTAQLSLAASAALACSRASLCTVTLLLLGALLSACASQPADRSVPVLEGSASGSVNDDEMDAGSDGAMGQRIPRVERGGGSVGAGSSAVASLIADVDRYLAANEPERAAAAAERAIRIAPTSAQAYFALAQVRYHQAQYTLSRSLLEKSRSLARSADMYRAIERFMARPGYR